MAFFNYQGKNIYYQEIGTGKPLFLLHGNTASSNMFDDLKDLYASQYQVILIDFLGHGRSDRLEHFPVDLWFEEARQVIALIKEKGWQQVNLIGSSGGALVAINAALEAPELIEKIIADSFEGEVPLKAYTKIVTKDRAESKKDPETRAFYQHMHGEGWEQIVDQDTAAIVEHDQKIGRFFHKPLEQLKAEILLTGSKGDEFVSLTAPDFFERVFGEILKKTGHGQMHLFESGGHPAMLSNGIDFFKLIRRFLGE